MSSLNSPKYEYDIKNNVVPNSNGVSLGDLEEKIRSLQRRIERYESDGSGFYAVFSDSSTTSAESNSDFNHGVNSSESYCNGLSGADSGSIGTSFKTESSSNFNNKPFVSSRKIDVLLTTTAVFSFSTFLYACIQLFYLQFQLESIQDEYKITSRTAYENLPQYFLSNFDFAKGPLYSLFYVILYVAWYFSSIVLSLCSGVIMSGLSSLILYGSVVLIALYILNGGQKKQSFLSFVKNLVYPDVNHSVGGVDPTLLRSRNQKKVLKTGWSNILSKLPVLKMFVGDSVDQFLDESEDININGPQSHVNVESRSVSGNSSEDGYSGPDGGGEVNLEDSVTGNLNHPNGVSPDEVEDDHIKELEAQKRKLEETIKKRRRESNLARYESQRQAAVSASKDSKINEE